MQKAVINGTFMLFGFLLALAIVTIAVFNSEIENFSLRLEPVARNAKPHAKPMKERRLALTLNVTTITNIQLQINETGTTADRLFKARRNAVRAACLKAGIKQLDVNASQLNDAYEHMIVDDAHRLIYCYVPKAACTSWKRVMLRLKRTRTRDPHNMTLHLRMSDLSDLGRQRRMKSYKKFMVHREPRGRLLSAYIDKFVKENKMMRLTYGRKIISRYRRKASMHSLQYGDDVSFSEFAHFVVDSAQRNQWMDSNEHWLPQVKLCQPCTVDYDYYSGMETVESDAEAILKIILAPARIKFTHTHNTNSSQRLSLFYSGLSRNLTQRLWAVYEYDFAIFGYKKHEAW